MAWVAIGDEARRSLEVAAVYSSAIDRWTAKLADEVGRLLKSKRRQARVVAEAIAVGVEGALRVAAGGGFAAGGGAQIVQNAAAALLNDAAARP